MRVFAWGGVSAIAVIATTGAQAAVIFDRFRVGSYVGIDYQPAAGDLDEIWSLGSGHNASSASFTDTDGSRYVAGSARVDVNVADPANATFSLRSDVSAVQNFPSIRHQSIIETQAAFVYYFTLDQNSVFSFSGMLNQDFEGGFITTTARYVIDGTLSGNRNHSYEHPTDAIVLRPDSYSFLVLLNSYTYNYVGANGISAVGAFNISPYAGHVPGPGSVPEPASWALMVGGFGLVGGTLRRRRLAAASGLAGGTVIAAD